MLNYNYTECSVVNVYEQNENVLMSLYWKF